MTSSVRFGSMPARSSAARVAITPRSTALKSFNTPSSLATGVLAPDSMRASVMISSFLKHNHHFQRRDSNSSSRGLIAPQPCHRQVGVRQHGFAAHRCGVSQTHYWSIGTVDVDLPFEGIDEPPELRAVIDVLLHLFMKPSQPI